MPKCECSAGKVGASVRSTSWSVQGAEAKSCAVRAVRAVVSGPWGDRDALHSKIRISLQKLSAISTCIEKKKSLDATRLLQARSRIPSSRPHGTIGPSGSRCPRSVNIPRLHAPKLLTDLTTCTPPRTASILSNGISNHQVRTSPPVPQLPNLRGEALRSLDPWPLYRFQLECRF